MDSDAVTLYVGSNPLVTAGPVGTVGASECPVCAEESVPGRIKKLLATEYQAFAMYRHGAYLMRGKDRIDFTAELLTHADEELEHADWWEKRLLEVGGGTFKDTAEYNTTAPTASPTLCGNSPEEIFQVMEKAEIDAINLYRDAFEYFMSAGDIVSAKIARTVLAKEEEHLSDIRIDYMGKQTAV